MESFAFPGEFQTTFAGQSFLPPSLLGHGGYSIGTHAISPPPAGPPMMPPMAPPAMFPYPSVANIPAPIFGNIQPVHSMELALKDGGCTCTDNESKIEIGHFQPLSKGALSNFTLKLISSTDRVTVRGSSIFVSRGEGREPFVYVQSSEDLPQGIHIGDIWCSDAAVLVIRPSPNEIDDRNRVCGKLQSGMRGDILYVVSSVANGNGTPLTVYDSNGIGIAMAYPSKQDKKGSHYNVSLQPMVDPTLVGVLLNFKLLFNDKKYYNSYTDSARKLKRSTLLLTECFGQVSTIAPKPEKRGFLSSLVNRSAKPAPASIPATTVLASPEGTMVIPAPELGRVQQSPQAFYEAPPTPPPPSALETGRQKRSASPAPQRLMGVLGSVPSGNPNISVDNQNTDILMGRSPSPMIGYRSASPSIMSRSPTLSQALERSSTPSIRSNSPSHGGVILSSFASPRGRAPVPQYIDPANPPPAVASNAREGREGWANAGLSIRSPSPTGQLFLMPPMSPASAANSVVNPYATPRLSGGSIRSPSPAAQFSQGQLQLQQGPPQLFQSHSHNLRSASPVFMPGGPNPMTSRVVLMPESW